jgi:hypothetical protein
VGDGGVSQRENEGDTVEVQEEKQEGYEQEEEEEKEVINVMERGLSEDGVTEGDTRVQ